MATGAHILCSLCATAIVLVGYLAQASHGWVLGARASPFADLTHRFSNGAEVVGPDEFRLHDSDAAVDHFRKRSSSGGGGGDYDSPPAPFKRSGDDTPFQLCGRPLDKVIRFVCRNYYNEQRRGRRSADDWLTSIFSPEEYKVRSRAKRSAGASDLCCRRSCRRSELIQFC